MFSDLSATGKSPANAAKRKSIIFIPKHASPVQVSLGLRLSRLLALTYNIYIYLYIYTHIHIYIYIPVYVYEKPYSYIHIFIDMLVKIGGWE